MLVCNLCSNKSNEIMHRTILLTVIEYMCASFTSNCICSSGLIFLLSVSHGLWLLTSMLKNANSGCQHFLKQRIHDFESPPYDFVGCRGV